MPVNTGYIESGPAVFSSISLNGSGATLTALTVSASSLTVSGTVFFATGQQSVGLQINTGGWINVPDGTVIRPSFEYTSEASLGLYRSAASIMALSYGFFSAPGLISSVTTAQSASSAKVTQQGQIIFSILSLTTNGCQMFYRSGNSVYVFVSGPVAVG